MFWLSKGRLGLLGQHGHHHADEIDDGGIGLPDLLPETGGAEALLHHQRRPCCQGAHGGVVLCIRMKEGKAGEEAVVAAGLSPVGEPLPGSNVHLVGEHYTLGVARGAGGVHEHADVLRGDGCCCVDGGGTGEGFGEARPA